MAAACCRCRWSDNTLDGRVHDCSQFGCQGVLQREDAQLIDGSSFIPVNLADQSGDFIEITRSCPDNDRVGAGIRGHQDFGTQIHSFCIELNDHVGHFLGHRILQAEHLEFGLWIDWTVQFFCKFKNRFQVCFRSNDQQRVWLIDRQDRGTLTRLGCFSWKLGQSLIDGC